MSLKHFRTLPILALALGACGASKTEIPADPIAAIEVGDKALANSELEVAVQAFQAVSNSAEAPESLKYQSLIKLGKTQLAMSDPGAAGISFTKARNDYGHLYGFKDCVAIIDAYIGNRMTDEADAELKVAFEKFPDQKDALGKQAAAITALLSGDDSALAELGYVGD